MSASDMNATLEKKTSWKKEPMVWMLIALPLSAVIGGGLTIWFAANGADTLVSEKYVKEGLAVHQVAEGSHAAQAKGLAANLVASPGHLTVQLEGHLERPPTKLTLTLAHTTQADRHLVLMLEPTTNGGYDTAYASVPDGEYRLELVPDVGTWRIAGRWTAPFSGSTRLAASDQLSSTQP